MAHDLDRRDAYAKVWREKNRLKVRAYNALYQRKRRAKLKEEGKK